MSAAGDGGTSPAAVRVKEELEWVEIEIECGVSEETRSSLYAKQEVKRELVLCPERLQPQDIAYSIQKSSNKTDMVTVKQELEVGEGPKAELPGEAPGRAKSCEEQYPFKTCFVKLERISIDEEQHACMTCHKTFDQKSSLTSHRCINSEETSCSNVVMSKKVIKQCRKKKSFKCDTCGKCVTRKEQLIIHIRTHTGEKPYSCKICTKQFKGKSYLAKHNRIHTGEKPYLCEICKKQFTQRFHLARHKLTHTGAKPYFCEICKKQFTQSSSLASHRLIHTGEKPYSCEICKKQFTQRSTLAGHRLIHTKEKPYSCDKCKKHFSRRSRLSKHMLSHTGERLYSCDVCNRSFKYQAGFTAHQRSSRWCRRIREKTLPD